MIGEVVGSYRIVSVLGRGGMGIVYRAAHVQLGRRAALKMLLPHFTHDAAVVQRFFNEARAASAVDHPGIVEIFDYGTHTDGRAFIVMALLEGETLTAHIENRAIAPREAAAILAQVATALAAAHAAGIVHRDLKPDNIVLVANEHAPFGWQAKLLDFGIAKLADDATGKQTQTGLLIGTPLYMSPEQCMGAPDIDHRTDLYALGCILYHMLAGRPPFESAAGAGAIVAAHLRDEPPDPRTFVSSIPSELVHVVMQLLAKDPAARIQSATALRDVLCGVPAVASSFISEVRAVVAHPTTATGAAAQLVPVVAPKRRPVLLVLAVAAAVGGGFVLARARGNELARGVTPAAVAAPPAPTTVVADPWAAAAKPAPKPAPAKPRRRIALDARHYEPHDRIAVTFTSFAASTPSDRAWLAIAEAGKPSPGHETWMLVENGARHATLLAPTTPGAYEVRLYKNLDLQATARFAVDSE